MARAPHGVHGAHSGGEHAQECGLPHVAGVTGERERPPRARAAPLALAYWQVFLCLETLSLPLPFPCSLPLFPTLACLACQPISSASCCMPISQKEARQETKAVLLGIEDTESGAQAARGPLGNKIRKD